jgi:hypothetical protein
MPWIARNAISSRIEVLSPDSADQEDHDGGLEEDLAAVLVAELAPQRGRGGRGQDVGGDDPRQVRQAVQVAGDGRQRRGHDGLVQRGEQHPEQQRPDDHQQPPLVDRGRPGRHGDAGHSAPLIR